MTDDERKKLARYVRLTYAIIADAIDQVSPHDPEQSALLADLLELREVTWEMWLAFGLDKVPDDRP